ncbi:hypothetical protein TPHV1_120060 [Treponema phagedenis]|uniref:Uncharacterized protein n=1 Tax=Treponema phagedenis TaxID=162 RepID=A0A0B7GWB2_TREPH|nr:hypothetical protein TPHV1_120060 [Treponema phagedenis]
MYPADFWHNVFFDNAIRACSDFTVRDKNLTYLFGTDARMSSILWTLFQKSQAMRIFL